MFNGPIDWSSDLRGRDEEEEEDDVDEDEDAAEDAPDGALDKAGLRIIPEPPDPLTEADGCRPDDDVADMTRVMKMCDEC